MEDRPDKIIKHFCTLLQKLANQYILKGKQGNYKPFWTPQLQLQKKTRDQARMKVGSTKNRTDIIQWRKEATKLCLEITNVKKKSFTSFLRNLNYKTDSRKTYQFMNKLNNKFPRNCSTIIVNGEL